MSLIFEALQRVESERTGSTEATSATATEILRRVEEQARAQHNVASLADGTEASRGFQQGRNFSSPGLLTSLGQSASENVAADQIDLKDCRSLPMRFPFHNRLVALADRESPAAEAFRLLGVRLRHLRRERVVKTLLICSPSPQEGKSMISANLACTIAAASRQNVLLIEGDIRRPSLGDLFQLDPHPGLCQYLEGEHSLTDCIYRLEEAGLYFLPASTSSDSHSELIQSSPLPHMLEQLRASFQWIIIDSPPILPLADTSIWTRLADSIVLVTRNGITEKQKLQRGIEALDESKLVGAIVNSATSSTQEDYYYYYRSRSERPD